MMLLKVNVVHSNRGEHPRESGTILRPGKIPIRGRGSMDILGSTIGVRSDSFRTRSVQGISDVPRDGDRIQLFLSKDFARLD